MVCAEAVVGTLHPARATQPAAIAERNAQAENPCSRKVNIDESLMNVPLPFDRRPSAADRVWVYDAPLLFRDCLLHLVQTDGYRRNNSRRLA
jgi:hypothetical protein